MNYITIFLQIKSFAWVYRPLFIWGLGGWFWLGGLVAEAQVFSHGQLIPTLIPMPSYANPNNLIPPLVPQLIPTLPGDTTCSPFQNNLSQCLNQYRNTTIPEPVLRSILPRNPEPAMNTSPPTPTPSSQVVNTPPPLPASGTVTAANCPKPTTLVLLPGGYACMQTRN